MKTVTPEYILPEDNWLNAYRSDIEVEIGRTRETRDENELEDRARIGSPDVSAMVPAGQFPSQKWPKKSMGKDALKKILRVFMKF